MAKDNATARKSEKVQLAKISAVQAIIVALIAAIATAIPVYFAGRYQGKESANVGPTPSGVPSNQPAVGTTVTPKDLSPNQSARLITRADLIKLLGDAQIRVFAAGYVLEPIDPRVLAEKVSKNRKFEVKIMLVDPNNPVVCLRDKDGGSKTPGYKKLKDKIDTINRYRQGLPEERFRLKLSGRYPMMAVYIIDNDVFAHFYPYAVSGSDSPILRLDQNDKNAEFFRNHFDSIFEDKESKLLLPEIEYQAKDPCSATHP
jgi:hypothetical protein